MSENGRATNKESNKKKKLFCFIFHCQCFWGILVSIMCPFCLYDVNDTDSIIWHVPHLLVTKRFQHARHTAIHITHQCFTKWWFMILPFRAYNTIRTDERWTTESDFFFSFSIPPLYLASSEIWVCSTC